MSEVLDNELYDKIEFFARIKLNDSERLKFNKEFCLLANILSRLDSIE